MSHYSQSLEEQYILRACEDSANKRVLDIGAFDAKCFSNSRALIEAGWGAVLIEPSPGPVRALVTEYADNPNVVVIAGAVALSSGLIALRVTDDAVSSSDAAHVLQWRQHTKFLGPMAIWAMTIEDILNRYGAFDCVSIDTEGSSVDLLKALLNTEMFPRCIVCEYNDRLSEAQQAAQERGYSTVYTSNENVVLVHQ